MNPEMGSDENMSPKVDSFSRIDKLTGEIFHKVESTTSPLCDFIEGKAIGLENTLVHSIEMATDNLEMVREIAREKHQKFIEYKNQIFRKLSSEKDVFDEVATDPTKLVILFNAIQRAVNNSSNTRELYTNMVVNSPLFENLGMVDPLTVSSTVFAIIAIYFAADMYNNFECGKAKEGVIEANAASDPMVPSTAAEADVAYLFYEAIKSRKDVDRRVA